MRWRLVITPRAERELKGLRARDQTRIREALDGLTTFPPQGDLRKLRGREDEWRLRVGDYRVRFIRDSRNRVVVVLRVQPVARHTVDKLAQQVVGFVKEHLN